MSTPGLIPDGTGWVDVYGRPWVSNGDNMMLWALPVVTLLGDNPQTIVQDASWVDFGATATDANDTDITGSVVVDSTALDTSMIGDYPVTYTATDSEGYSDVATRTVVVIDVDRPDVRDTTLALLEDGLPDGVYVHRTPAEQVKAPAVVIGTMSWTPGRMASLEDVTWEIDIQLLTVRGKPDYSLYSIETMSKKVAQLLLAGNYRVEGFTSEGIVTVGGVDLLAGTLSVIYKERT